MSEVIICPNPECGAENPINAKFCRMCKHPLSVSKDEYTPNYFPDIALRPISVCPVHFVHAIQKLSYVLLPLCVFYMCCLYCWSSLDDKALLSINVCIAIYLICPSAILCIYGINNHMKSVNFSQNVDYIEEGFFLRKMKRVAKNKKIGLFDCITKRIVLTPIYDSISKLDEMHVQLERNKKMGLYSIRLRKIIVPIEFDGIASIQNGVIEVVKDSHLSHYDIYGNVLN